MDFNPNEEQKLIASTIREFAEKEIRPIASDIEEEMRFPVELLPRMGEVGLMGMQIPAKYGGGEIGTVSYAMAIEELARVSASVSIIVSVHNSLVLYPMLKFGSDEQKERYIPDMVRGKKLGAYCITEATAGSDVSNESSTGIRDGGDYVLNGEKLFITNGDKADVFFVMIRTSPGKGSRGLSAFVIERGTRGFNISEPMKKMGLNASGTVSIKLDDCRVPAGSMLGKEGEGMKIALSTLDGGRIGVGAQSLGIAQGAFEAALDYSKQREQFGKRISEFQGIQWMLADMAMNIEAARMLLYRAAFLRDEGKNYSLAASMAKLFASETASMVADRALLIHGGIGNIRGTPVERFYRDARITRIYEGTSEIHRHVISRALLK